MSVEDTIRQVDKTIDVLSRVETMMTAEAEMNAAKHLSDKVHPNPLAASVTTLLGDLRFWRDRLERTLTQPD